MEPTADDGCAHRVQALGKESTDRSGEDVTGTTRCESRVAGRVDEDLAVGVGDQCPEALGHHDRLCALGGVSRGGYPVRNDVFGFTAKKAGQLARVGCQYRRLLSSRTMLWKPYSRRWGAKCILPTPWVW